MLNLTTEMNGRVVGPSSQFLDADAASDAASASAIAPAVQAAAKVAEAALRAEVSKLGKVTGNLAASVGVRSGTDGGVAYADVGFFESGSPHGHLVEYGTVVRTRRSAGIFSSWSSRGRWVGMGTYPQNFVARSPNAGAMPAFHPLQNARQASSEPAAAIVEQGLAGVAQAAVDAATG